MPKNDGTQKGNKREIFRVALFSRRQFLKRTGTAAAGALITSLAAAAACKTSIISTLGVTADTAGGTSPTTTKPSTAASAPSSSVISSTVAATVSTTPDTGATVPAYNYVPPSTSASVLPIAGTTCSVATDRQYSTDNVWVKSLSDNVVLMGITTTMVEIIYNPYHLSLSKVGTALVKDDAFGSVEGTKMNADLISPVSGTVIQVNPVLNSLIQQNAALTPVIQDPYNSGWMIVVQISNPAELNDLVTPQRYVQLVTKQ